MKVENTIHCCMCVIINVDNSKQAMPSSTENESCFYAEAGMPVPNYEEPNPLEYVSKSVFLYNYSLNTLCSQSQFS